jgi:uncharacterized protein YceK
LWSLKQANGKLLRKIQTVGRTRVFAGIASHDANRHSRAVTIRKSVSRGERRQVRRVAAAFFCGIFLAALGSGCGTVMNQYHGDHYVYGGVKRDWHDLKAQQAPEGIAIAAALDLPLSAIADTLCLPWDASREHDLDEGR